MAAVAAPIFVVAFEELMLAMLGTSAIMVSSRLATKEETAALNAASEAKVGGGGCKHQFCKSNDTNFICQSLGLERRSCGNKLHKIKQQNKGFLAGNGKRHNENVSVCVKCGLVVEANSGEPLDYLE